MEQKADTSPIIKGTAHSEFERLFRSSYSRLVFYARGFMGDEAEAEDVVEDVFVDLWRRKDSVDFGEGIEGYLFRAVYTRCINALKVRNVGQGRLTLLSQINERRMETIGADSADPSVSMENADLRRDLESAIESLPEKCRIVFRMSYINDMHNDDIARVLNLSVRTVEHHIYRALRALRKKLSGGKFFSIFVFCFLLTIDS